ncbi:MAG: dihydrodipicolinate synthase family protein [Candidatus Omnitrophica bacterium]|nr:dihydrodipicolinate synthase family protein [Candidatus Omnitrophota bacterium]
MENTISGVMPAVITPRDDDGAVAVKQIQPLVDFLFSKGVDGLFVCGTTGEGISLTVEERKLVLENIIESAAGRGKIIAHVGAVSARDAYELAEHAGKAGADAVSSVPPFYYRLGLEEIKRHYGRIRDLSRRPVLIYDIPSATNVTLTPAMVTEMVEDGLVCGIKNPRAYLYDIDTLARLNNGRCVVFTGETQYASCLIAGYTAGTIGSVANWAPEFLVGIKKNVEAGNHSRACELQRFMLRVFAVYAAAEIAATKTLVGHRGIFCGDPWPPLRSLNSGEKQALCRAIDEFKLDYDALTRT